LATDLQPLEIIAHYSDSPNNIFACICGAQQLCHFLTFDSLQDTVIATQAMSSVAGLLVDRTQDLTMAVSHSKEKTFSRSIHITSANSMVFNQINNVSLYSQLLRRIQVNRETRAHLFSYLLCIDVKLLRLSVGRWCWLF